ncbi:trihelix transcription factor [Iris pallida]|uniref:Trihelix transcription factor n=1 Tax=Iris pallida TaxID=29817 RepID=A0AAX6I2T7_IRIPA|nr:trihelix transcription factor [Iris pallida]KAJ6847596.1 trihelix transcription factor [Iris pallida]
MDDDDSPSPPPPNPNPSATQTLAPSPQKTLTLALPIQTPSPSPAGAGGGSSGRDDCWSEGATSALIDAWGERYLHLSRGNLKQKHWQEVADAVTARDGYTKPPRTDVQCKNRVDTLKKKYKSEKSRPSPSLWPFFHRLDELIGPVAKPNPNPSFPQFPQKLRTKKRSRDISPASASPESSDSLPPPAAAARPPDGKTDVGALTRAVLRLGEVYEKVERSKTRQAAEMERQRMGFVRELEMQRMQFFMKTQMELSQLRRNHRRRQRRHHRDGGSGDSLNGDDNNNNNSHHHHHRNGGGEGDGDGNNSE